MTTQAQSLQRFLADCGLTPDEYQALAPVDRAAIMASFRTSMGSFVSSAPPQATVSAQPIKVLPPLPVRTDAESYELLIEQAYVLMLGEVICGPKLSRSRMSLTRKPLNAKWTSQLTVGTFALSAFFLSLFCSLFL